MTSSRLILPASLLVLTACGGSAPATSDHPGLILARSSFNDGGGMMPAELILLRADDDTGASWTAQQVSAKASPLKLQLGDAADGQVVFRSVDGSGNPVGGPVELVAEPGVWKTQAAADVNAAAVTWRTKNDAPQTKDFEMIGGNVFHKAMWFEPAHGEPGILTISANVPQLTLWHASGAKWKPEVLWTASVGGKEHRFRDLEVGDVDQDGEEELVLVTHDHGEVYVLEQTAAGLQATRVHVEAQRTFVHEVEIGDVNGDGKLEFFTTPSEPNRAGVHDQAGSIDMYRWDGTAYQRTRVFHSTDSHCKEILLADNDGDGADELYAAVEAPPAQFEVRRFLWDGSTMAPDFSVAMGREDEFAWCRFLVQADTDGDGVPEILAAARIDGIYRLVDGSRAELAQSERDKIQEGANGWSAKRIVQSYYSGGFEHAIYCMDWDQDGHDDIFVASDRQATVQRFSFNPVTKAMKGTVILDLRDEIGNYIIWNVMPLPPGH